MRTNYFIWSGVYRTGIQAGPNGKVWHDQGKFGYPTVVIDVDLASWALPFAFHIGGPLLGKPGFHFRVGPINIGWSKL